MQWLCVFSRRENARRTLLQPWMHSSPSCGTKDQIDSCRAAVPQRGPACMDVVSCGVHSFQIDNLTAHVNTWYSTARTTRQPRKLQLEGLHSCSRCFQKQNVVPSCSFFSCTALETVNTMSSLGTVDWAGRPRRRTRFRRFASLAIGGSVDIRPWGHPANTHVKRHLGHDAQQCDVPDVDKGRVHRTVR